ncbi:family 1 glycosylhydrolase [Bradyrhizobium sp. WYCCWR 12678]|nr:family 1 glycosylhydrolase [Bradyrhizobium zhengyangense]MCG2642919.1 family 1 glycosylhydrolase [Bradyrhizobium zhengyangense]
MHFTGGRCPDCEWVFGLNRRFGLYHVNFDAQVRTAKLCASCYRNVIANNAAVA